MAVSAELVSTNGMWVEYYNNRSFSGTPDTERYENQDLYYNWGSGHVTSITSNNVSVRWQTKLVAPYSETYTIYFTVDPAFAIYLDGELKTNFWRFAGA